MSTYRKHFEDLQPVGSPAFLGFVDRQREVNVSGILREEQHQEDSPAHTNKSSSVYFPYCIFSCERMNPVWTFPPVAYVGPQRLQSQSIILTAREKANQWQLPAHIVCPSGAGGLRLQCKQPWHSRNWCHITWISQLWSASSPMSQSSVSLHEPVRSLVSIKKCFLYRLLLICSILSCRYSL